MRLPEWINDSKAILVAPLNWGLGHATRCIPIIRHLISKGKKVVIASDGHALELLKEEFPYLPHHALPEYDIHYKYPSMTINMAIQSWKIIKAIRSEKKEVEKLVRQHDIDTIISDNRYGVLNESCKSVILCHQINILHPFKPLARVATAINHRWINKFNECWVPDFPPPNNLSGKLSLSTKVNKLRFIDALSRFEPMNIPIEREILVILSGPEPSRTVLESKLLKVLDKMDIMMVRGVYSTQDQSHLVNFMNAVELNRAICSSRLIICRSGYTSLMDLLKLKKKAILIPTPGQGEQEYLAKLAEKHYNTYFKVIKESEIEEQLYL